MAETPHYLLRGTPPYRRANLALFFAGFVAFSTLYDFQPLLPFLSREFGVTPTVGSLALSAATFALAWTLPLSGTLSDALGRRRLMAVAVLLTSLLALATATVGNLTLLIALRLLQGIVLAGVPAVAMAYLSEEVEPQALSAAMGLYIAGNAMGGMSGRILTAGLVDFLPWRTAVAVIGGLSLLLSGLFLLLLPPSRHFHRRPFRVRPLTSSLLAHLREPGLICLFAVAFACMGAFVSFYNYVIFRLLAPPYALSSSQVGWIFLSYAFGACGSGIMGGLVERFGRGRVLLTSLAMMTAGLLLTLLSPLPVLLGGTVVITVGFFGAHSTASAWVGARTRKNRAQAASLYLLSYYLGSSISGTGGGYFWSRWGWNGVAALILALIGLAVLAALRLVLLEKRTATATPGAIPLPHPSGCCSQATHE